MRAGRSVGSLAIKRSSAFSICVFLLVLQVREWYRGEGSARMYSSRSVFTVFMGEDGERRWNSHAKAPLEWRAPTRDDAMSKKLTLLAASFYGQPWLPRKRAFQRRISSQKSPSAT
jgi:hypothetical protein